MQHLPVSFDRVCCVSLYSSADTVKPFETLLHLMTPKKKPTQKKNKPYKKPAAKKTKPKKKTTKWERRPIKPNTMERLKIVAHDGETDDQVVNRLIEMYFGFEAKKCQHEHKMLVMEVVLDKNGFLSVEKTIDVFDRLRYGKPVTEIRYVCRECGQSKKYEVVT